LKSLVEDGQMVLGDGRRIISKESDIQDNDRYILVHPNFRMLVLANRPGKPKNGYSSNRMMINQLASFSS
jgi:hypothetical protein